MSEIPLCVQFPEKYNRPCELARSGACRLATDARHQAQNGGNSCRAEGAITPTGQLGYDNAILFVKDSVSLLAAKGCPNINQVVPDVAAAFFDL